MALTGLQIYQLLPKTNCRKCGFPTCLAFAMALAQGRVSLDKCPDISEEAKEKLSKATQPLMKTIRFGLKDCEYVLGGEVVLFRHEKTFYHQPLLVVLLSDTLSLEEFIQKVEKMKSMEFERVGEKIKIDMLAIKNDSKNKDTFVHYVQLARDLPMILISDDLEVIKKAREVLYDQIPVVLGDATEEWVNFALKSDTVLVIGGKSLEEIAVKSMEAQSLGLENIVLYPEVRNMEEALITYTQSWKMALEKRYRPLGFPLLGWAGNDLALASNFICKYAGIVILETIHYQDILPLITLRLNIYTDPQKPQMIEPKVYEVGKPDEHSPVLVTTNFSLTFFTVQSEIEHSKIPSYLLVTDSEGMSVQTAYAADKFNADIITKAMKDSGLEEKVKHRKMIIPGYVAILKSGLEEESGWEILVGPKEANGIPKFLRALDK